MYIYSVEAEMPRSNDVAHSELDVKSSDLINHKQYQDFLMPMAVYIAEIIKKEAIHGNIQ